MSKIIEKKVWPEYFGKILSGVKTYEVRLADFDCQVGDVLRLREWSPDSGKYTGREVLKKVGIVSKTKNFKFWNREEIEKYGYQIIGFKNDNS